jgi:hypothetical protein
VERPREMGHQEPKHVTGSDVSRPHDSASARSSRCGARTRALAVVAFRALTPRALSGAGSPRHVVPGSFVRFGGTVLPRDETTGAQVMMLYHGRELLFAPGPGLLWPREENGEGKPSRGRRIRLMLCGWLVATDLPLSPHCQWAIERMSAGPPAPIEVAQGPRRTMEQGM